MKAVICRTVGSVENLVIGEAPKLVPGRGEVIINVAAAGVNYLDVLMIQGKYPLKPPLPFSPGCEASGIIDAVGDGVANLEPGQRVMAFVPYGAFAAQVRADASFVFPIPDSMSFPEAAGFLVTYGTAYHALRKRAQLAEGEVLLVLGAAGGVGLTAVEIGRLLGAQVIAAASSAQKLALCQRYGAQLTINYLVDDLRTRVGELTDGRGADVVFDPVGGDLTEAALRSVAFLGRFLIIGFAAGIPRVPLNLILFRSATAFGISWGAFGRARPLEIADDISVLLQWHQEGRIQPHISDIYPMTQCAQALRSIMNRKAQGKVVIQITPE